MDGKGNQSMKAVLVSGENSVEERELEMKDRYGG